MTDILQKIGEVSFPGTERFIASESFRINTSDDASVKISYLGKNFPLWFIDKIESRILCSVLRYSRLMKSTDDSEIISVMGGEEKSEVTLAEMFFVMTKQPQGEEGVLLNDGSVNFFYIRDISGALRTIRLLWQDGGWGIHAIRPLDVLNLPKWPEGSQIFYRN